MSDQKNSINDTLARIMLDVNNMQAFINALNTMLSTKSDSVEIEQKKEDGSTETVLVPSFGYLRGRIDEISNEFEAILSANDDVVGVKLQDGTTRKFELKKVSQLISDLESIQGAELEIPTEFRVKNNWFFESFLNPLLFVSVDVSPYLTDDIDKFSVKRIIINTNDDDQLTFFDENIKGQNDLSLNDLILTLEDEGIDYFEDDNLVDMPAAVNRYRGTFDVIKVFEEEIIENTNGEELSIIRRKYKLDSLNYTDILDETEGTKFIAEGDKLTTNGDTEYTVVSVNRQDKTVVLERTFGLEAITIGVDVLRIAPEPFRVPELQINVGYNERQVIFTRPISRKRGLTTDQWSAGFALYSNELNIVLEDGSVSPLNEFYNNFVSDFGLLFLNYAKERKLPTSVGATPNAPTLDPASFQVRQIDTHIKEDENVIKLKERIASKEKLKSEVTEIDKKIGTLKKQLNSGNTAVNESERNRIQKQINENADLKTNKLSQLSTTVKELTLDIKTNPEFIITPKYRVLGFWDIPTAQETVYGRQEIIAFKVQYRYLSRKGSAPNAEQIKFTDASGAERTAFKSPWEEVITKQRQKKFDDDTGLFAFVDENVSDPDAVNTNQIEIPIRKGEIVEVRIKSLSEAGWPDNPVESEWSNTIQVGFPEDTESQEESTFVTQETFAEESRVQFQEELNARGLDLHLLNAFTTGERYFGHKASDVATDSFTDSGVVIDLQQKLNQIETLLNSTIQAIQEEAGVLKATIYDTDGNAIEVTNGSTIDLFGGYYKDLIKDTSSGSVVYNEGQIVTKQWTLSLENTSQTNLEFISTLFGGIDQAPETSDPLTFPTADYHVNRRYDIVPISAVENPVPDVLESIKQPPSNQSSQVKSQYIVNRYRDYGLTNDLYAGDYSVTAGYNFQGQLVSGTEVPYNWGHYLPYDPNYASSFATNADIWDGTTDGAGTPQGGGYLSEFCIHTDHPIVNDLGASYDISVGTNLEDLFRPEFEESGGNITGVQQYYNFSHSLHFETEVDKKTNVFGQDFFKQAAYETPAAVPGDLNTNREDNHYPIKLGFKPNDEFLVGKYTCGAYFFMFPQRYENVSVDGNAPGVSVKTVEFGSEKALNIPLVFQFRCSDKLGRIGGFRQGEILRNVSYTKKLGFDIYIKDQTPFNFDVAATCIYQKETTLDSPIVPSRGTVNVNFG